MAAITAALAVSTSCTEFPSVSVKDVKHTMSKTEKNETNTDSAEPVLPESRYDVIPGKGLEPVRLRCSKCNMATKHVGMDINVVPRFEVKDPINEVLKHNKRIIMCSVCANMSLRG